MAKETAQVAEGAIADQRDYMAEQRAEREQKAAAKRAAAEQTSTAAAHMADAVVTAATAGADDAAQYFTYNKQESVTDAAAADSADSANTPHVAAKPE